MSSATRPPNAHNTFLSEFTVAPNTQKVWKINHPIWFFAMGVGGALYLLRWLTGLQMGTILDLPVADVLGLSFVGVGGIILISDLGRPAKFLGALRNFRRSWISVGAICDFILLILGTLYILPQLELLGSRPFVWLPWTPASIVGEVLQALAGIAAIVVMVYAGFVLATSPSIPFWNTKLVPLQFFLYSVSSAYALFFINLALFPYQNSANSAKTLEVVFVSFIILSLLSTMAHISKARNASKRPAMRESSRLLLEGRLRGYFLIGTVTIGLALPLLFAIFAYFSSGILESTAIGIASLLVLIGAFMIRYSIVKAGVYSPIWEGLFS